jgi:putative peptidoglycan lipid II flippase
MAYGDERAGYPRDRFDPDATAIFDPDATAVLPAVTAGSGPPYAPSAPGYPAPVAQGGGPVAPGGPGQHGGPGAEPTGGGGGRVASVLQNSAVMAVFSLISRVTGFLRATIIAAALGSSLIGDAYTTATFLPGMIYELLLGGTLASVLVPVLVRARTHDRDGGDGYAQRLLTLAVIGLGIAAALAVAAAPLLTVLLASGDASSGSRNLITTLSYLILPTIFFYGLSALFAAVLNTREHFAAPTWAPILNNIVVLGTFGLYIALYGTRELTPEQMTAGQVALVGGGTLLGIVVQSLALMPALRRVGFRWRWRFDFRSLGLRELARLGGWAFCYVLVSQIGLLVLLRLANEASARGEAGPLIFNNTFLLLMMAHGIVAVSIITALLPRMSAAAAQRRWPDFIEDLSRGTRLSLVALAPIGIAYAVLALPIARSLFEHGAFSHRDALDTSPVLLMAAIALIPFTLSQIYTFAFYALPDTRTPALINIPVVAVRIGLQVWIAAAFGAGFLAAGLMLGNGVSFLIAALISGYLLRRRVGPLGLSQILDTCWRVLLASVGAVAVGLAVSKLIESLFGHSQVAAAVQLVVGGVAIVASYLAFALLLRTQEVREVFDLVRRKLRR